MSHTVFCTKLQKELAGLEYPPFPGALGEEVYDNISAEAWQLWLNHQTMLINEYRLNLLDPKAKQFLQEQMRKFLFENEEQKPEGFEPPKSAK